MEVRRETLPAMGAVLDPAMWEGLTPPPEGMVYRYVYDGRRITPKRLQELRGEPRRISLGTGNGYAVVVPHNIDYNDLMKVFMRHSQTLTDFFVRLATRGV